MYISPFSFLWSFLCFWEKQSRKNTIFKINIPLLITLVSKELLPFLKMHNFCPDNVQTGQDLERIKVNVSKRLLHKICYCIFLIFFSHSSYWSSSNQILIIFTDIKYRISALRHLETVLSLIDRSEWGSPVRDYGLPVFLQKVKQGERDLSVFILLEEII